MMVREHETFESYNNMTGQISGQNNNEQISQRLFDSEAQLFSPKGLQKSKFGPFIADHSATNFVNNMSSAHWASKTSSKNVSFTDLEHAKDNYGVTQRRNSQMRSDMSMISMQSSEKFRVGQGLRKKFLKTTEEFADINRPEISVT